MRPCVRENTHTICSSDGLWRPLPRWYVRKQLSFGIQCRCGEWSLIHTAVHLKPSDVRKNIWSLLLRCTRKVPLYVGMSEYSNGWMYDVNGRLSFVCILGMSVWWDKWQVWERWTYSVNCGFDSCWGRCCPVWVLGCNQVSKCVSQ